MAKAKKMESNNEETAQQTLEQQDVSVEENTLREEQTGDGKAQQEEPGELEKTQAELAESKDKYLRLYSEFENFRRRTAKEKLEMVSTANEGLIVSLLPILDDFERADKNMSADTDVASIKEGVDLIYNKFKSALEQKGVKRIEADKGSDFDVEYHEAITQIPAPDVSLKGKVVDVIENGYKINDKVIRFAKVVTGA